MYRLLILICCFFCSSFLFFSCSNQTQDTYTYLVEKQDYRTVITVEGEVKPLRSQNFTCPAQVWDASIEYLSEHGIAVEAGDTIARLSSLELSTEYERLLKDVETREASYNKREAQIAMEIAVLEAQEKNNRAETSIIELDSTQKNYASTTDKKIFELELERALIQRDRIIKKLEATKLIGDAELRRSSLFIEKNKVKLSRVVDRQKTLVLTAPFSGILLRSYSPMTGELLAEGDNLHGGMSIAEIPDLSESEVIIQLTETQYKKVSINDHVEIIVESFSDDTIYGKLSHVSKIGKPKSRNSKINVFDARITLDSLPTYPHPELTALCHIYSNECIDTLVIPSFTVFKDDSLNFVYLKNQQRFIRKEVELAKSNETHCIISRGLSVGDEVSMARPDQHLIKGDVILLPEADAVQSSASEKNAQQ